MSNDALLFNTPDEDANFFEKDKLPSKYVYLAEGVYRIPIPWFFCFQETDLRTVTYEYDEENGGKVELTIPVTTTQKAIQNFLDAENLMRKVCDSEIAAGYHEHAVKLFSDFRYDYITMDYRDIFHSAEWDDDAFRRCFTRTESALKDIKLFAGYDDRFEPYSVDEFINWSPDRLDSDRNNNSAAIDSGFVSSEYRLEIPRKNKRKLSGAKRKPRPWWMFWR